MVNEENLPNLMELAPQTSEFRRIVRVFFKRKLAVIGLAIIALAIIVAIFAPLLAPYDPNDIDLINKLASPSQEHLLGTDPLGRDTFSRLIYASRISLIVGVGAVAVGSAIGMSLGLIAAFFGGVTSAVIMRAIDVLMSFPMILLAIVIRILLGSGLFNLILAISIGGIPIFCRLMYGQVLTVQQNEYVLANRVQSASPIWTIVHHIIPNAFPPLIVQITMQMGFCILIEAGLSFLNLGIGPPTAAWGSMIMQGYNYLLPNPELSLSPGFAVMLVVFGFNMMGDGLRDALDPRLRGVL